MILRKHYGIQHAFYYALTQSQYLSINTLVLSKCFGFYQLSSSLGFLYGSKYIVQIHYVIQLWLHKYDIKTQRNGFY